VQCIHQLKAERKQLQEQVECLEEKLDQCKTRNAELMSELSALQTVRDQLQAKTAECEKLAACNVRDLTYWHHCFTAVIHIAVVLLQQLVSLCE